jgi:hypothetical protein
MATIVFYGLGALVMSPRLQRRTDGLNWLDRIERHLPLDSPERRDINYCREQVSAEDWDGSDLRCAHAEHRLTSMMPAGHYR